MMWTCYRHDITIHGSIDDDCELCQAMRETKNYTFGFDDGYYQAKKDFKKALEKLEAKT